MLNWFKYFDQILDNFYASNISISSGQNMSQGEKCFNTCIFYTTSSSGSSMRRKLSSVMLKKFGFILYLYG